MTTRPAVAEVREALAAVNRYAEHLIEHDDGIDGDLDAALTTAETLAWVLGLADSGTIASAFEGTP